ncbi:hypothetical protein cypCar_00027369 [Cyprinus carpio]|nr:hypothetical protein cypCar_00027369 [Cyprinus carpio]
MTSKERKPVKLSLAAEEVALFFAQMLDHEYTTKVVFRNNFFRDWTKGEKDWEKYEVARRLKTCVDAIQSQYQEDLQMGTRQRVIALYFIDKVFKNLKLFMENKQEGDNLFDRLTTQMLNKHLSSFMPGLTAKVFRTYNASITLQQQLRELHNPKDNVAEKLLSYNRANRAVAFLSNHQLAPPKTFEQSMANQQAKIDSRKEQLDLAKKIAKAGQERSPRELRQQAAHVSISFQAFE